jgi:hypothetical protein
MSNQTQERRIIGLDAHPYLFSAVALSGANPLVAKTEWVLDRVSLDNLEKTLRKRLRPQASRCMCLTAKRSVELGHSTV